MIKETDDVRVETAAKSYHDIISDGVIAEMYRFTSIGLGRDAVLAQVQVTNEMLANDEPAEPWILRMQGRALARGRNYLANLIPAQQERLVQIIREQPPSPWLETQLEAAQQRVYGDQADGSAAQFIGALTAKKSAGRYAVPGKLLQNFFEWHNDSVVQRQLELDAEAPKFKADYQASVLQAITNQWMPEAAKDRLALAHDAVMVADDGLRTRLQNYKGYYHETIPRPSIAGMIVLDVLSDPEEQRYVVFHELTHALLKGYSLQLFGTGEGARMVHEALTEYVTVGLIHGQPFRMRDSPQRFYRADGNFFEFMNKKSAGVHPGLFLEACLADDEQTKQAAEDTLQAALLKVIPGYDIVKSLRRVKDSGELAELYVELLKRALGIIISR